MNLRDSLLRHEGEKLRPYRCTAGKLTIGVGRNLEDRGITHEEAMYLLDNDIALVKQQVAKEFPWILGLDEIRKDVIYEMCFQLGINRLSLFQKMLSAVREGDYGRAATEMLNSNWFRQTPGRCKELSEIMRNGG